MNVTHNFNPEVGDKAAVYYFTDVQPCTVIKRTKKFVTVQMDDYKLNKDSKPEIIPGGFAGHCTNQKDQKWDIVSNKDVPTVRARLRKDGYYHSAHGKHLLSESPRKFYDYNF